MRQSHTYTFTGWRTALCALLFFCGTLTADNTHTQLSFVPREQVHTAAWPLYDAIVDHVGPVNSAQRQQFIKMVGPHAQEALRLLKQISTVLEKDNTWQTHKAYRHMHDLYTLDWVESDQKDVFLDTIRDRLHQLADTLKADPHPGPLETALQKFATAALGLFIEPSRIGGSRLSIKRIVLYALLALTTYYGIKYLSKRSIAAMNRSLHKHQHALFNQEPLVALYNDTKTLLERANTEKRLFFNRSTGEDLTPYVGNMEYLFDKGLALYFLESRLSEYIENNKFYKRIIRRKIRDRGNLIAKTHSQMQNQTPGTPAYDFARRRYLALRDVTKHGALFGRYHKHPLWLTLPERKLPGDPEGMLTRQDIRERVRERNLKARQESRSSIIDDEDCRLENHTLSEVGLPPLTVGEFKRLKTLELERKGLHKDIPAWSNETLDQFGHRGLTNDLKPRLEEWLQVISKIYPALNWDPKEGKCARFDYTKHEDKHRLDSHSNWRNIARYLLYRLRGYGHHDALTRLAPTYMAQIRPAMQAFRVVQSSLMNKQYGDDQILPTAGSMRTWLDVAEQRHADGVDTTTYDDVYSHDIMTHMPRKEIDPYAETRSRTSWRHSVAAAKRGGPLAIKEHALITEIRDIYNHVAAQVAFREKRNWRGYGSIRGDLYHAMLPNKEKRQRARPRGWANFEREVNRHDLSEDKLLWETIGKLASFKQELANVRAIMREQGKQTLPLDADVDGLPPVPDHPGYLLLPQPNDSGIRKIHERENDTGRLVLCTVYPNSIQHALTALNWPGTPEAPVPWPVPTNRDPKLIRYTPYSGWQRENQVPYTGEHDLSLSECAVLPDAPAPSPTPACEDGEEESKEAPVDDNE